MLSIIIPTYNEERFLPSLLDSIIRQEIPGVEIIIADNFSADSTIRAAKKKKCRVVKGGSPARGKNNGAKMAKNDNLLFLDADTILPDDFLGQFMDTINKQGLDYAAPRIEPISDNAHHKFYYVLKNIGNFMISPLSPHTSGQCLFIKRYLFESIKGFDETLILGEEHDLVRRASRSGKGRFLWDMVVFNHPRRLIKEGTYFCLARDMASELHRFFAPIRKPIYERRYGHYDD